MPESGSIIAGVHAVEEALARPEGVNRLYIASDGATRAARQLVDRARAAGVRYDFVPTARINQLVGSGDHQGVAARVSPVDYTPLDDCLAACPAVARVLVLDQVQHPRNLGMLIRTAAGAGASGILLPARGTALLDDQVVRASAGMVFRVPVVQVKKLPAAFDALREAGFWIYGLDGAARESVFAIDWPERTALVVGNESTGLRPAVKKNCDALAAIPLAPGVESLNAAVAMGVALFQARFGQEKRPPR